MPRRWRSVLPNPFTGGGSAPARRGCARRPAAGQDLDAIGDIGALDNPDGPAPDSFQPIPQFGAGMTAAGKDMAQHGIARATPRSASDVPSPS